MGAGATGWDLATAFFSLGGLRLVGDALEGASEVRLLFGEDAERKSRAELMARMRDRSAVDLRDARVDDPLLEGLKPIDELFALGRFKARVYRRDPQNPANPDATGSFHAKVYIAKGLPSEYPVQAIAGSGNLSKNGLTRKIELGLRTNPEQATLLAEWFEARWAEAEEDDVTEELRVELLRHLDLYPPRDLVLRSLIEWADWHGTEAPPDEGKVFPILDPHQAEGVHRIRRILQREGGAMVCDGVGLGKSFVALAIVEDALRKGETVLLLAPRAILDSSWKRYQREYLSDYEGKLSTLVMVPITDFQTYPARGGNEKEEHEILDRLRRRTAREAEAHAAGRTEKIPVDHIAARETFLRQIEQYARKIDLLVVDESHNLRNPAASRYLNLMTVAADRGVRAKRTLLLTATPLNTQYGDLTAQFALAKGGDDARIGADDLAKLRKIARTLDADRDGAGDPSSLQQALGRIAIQRPRAVCRAIDEKAEKPLHFPRREAPTVVEYDLSPAYGDMVDDVEREFSKLAKFVADYRNAVRDKGDLAKLRLPSTGIRLSAYLPDVYLRTPKTSRQSAQRESFLASLVLTNVMKQLESSPAAFHSILQSLGAGLCARLLTAFPDDPAAAAFVNEHRGWINVRVRQDFTLFEDDLEAEDEPAVGTEPDEEDAGPARIAADRVETALRSSSLRHALSEFGPDTHRTDDWRRDLQRDLNSLQNLVDTVEKVRESAIDEKFDRMKNEILRLRGQGRKVLLFTQSVKTSEYLEDRLRKETTEKVARIDSGVENKRRAELLHRFAPEYNPPPHPGRMEPLDVLVCTDVLSEGVNLQQAGAIVNYDLHWNPVRLIQRIGRVDRRLARASDRHPFAILNVFPPARLERIIHLVATLERRVGKISRTLGIDQSFFRSEDEAGTLKEFDGMVDGTPSDTDRLLDRRRTLTEEEIARARLIPDGACGSWAGSCETGGFALFRARLRDDIDLPAADREALAAIDGQPVAVLLRDGHPPVTDPAEVLAWLDARVPEGPSADGFGQNPKVLLSKLRNAARNVLRLPSTATLDLVLWLELRP